MKRLIFGFILAALGIGLFHHFMFSEKELSAKQKDEQKLVREQTTYNAIIDIINSATVVVELENAKVLLLQLPPDKQKELAHIIELRIIILNFRRAESLLIRANKLQESIDPIPEPEPYNPYVDQPPPPPVELHPLVEDMVKEIVALYKDSKDRADRLEATNDVKFNFMLNFTKGIIYFRHTQYLSTRENVQQLFNQTVTYFKQALSNKPGDIPTVINVELLIKNQDKLLANALRGQNQKRRVLTPRAVGLGTSIGI